MASITLRIHPGDNICVALVDLQKDFTVEVEGEPIKLLNDIPAKHKFSLYDLNAGDRIMMYGVLVGTAAKQIQKGEIISTKNICHASDKYEYSHKKPAWRPPDVSAWKDRQFEGYHRMDGSVGTANYWLIIPMVFCENKNVEVIYDALVKELGYQTDSYLYNQYVRELIHVHQSGEFNDLNYANDSQDFTTLTGTDNRIFKNIDGVKLLTHTMGCGGTKTDTRSLCGLLAGYITHPNVAGATVLSLGCQNAQINILNEEIKKRDNHFLKPLFILEQQNIGNETILLHQAIRKTFAGLVQANKQERKPAPLSKLSIGLECGGSDGFSGISANPALGYASDLLVTMGASVILSEFPELCGVEQQLIDRCVDASVAERFMNLMNDYHKLAKSVGSGFDANPSAGNIADGLITDAIKSAGAARKAGTSPIQEVLDYPEKIRKPGLTLLCTPGSDIESTTAEVGAGATIIIFTTGLGTPTGNPVAPVVKVATNTPLFQKMNDIIDIDAGTVINGKETPQQVGERILEYIIKVASGELITKADANGHDEFIPWKRGISL